MSKRKPAVIVVTTYRIRSEAIAKFIKDWQEAIKDRPGITIKECCQAAGVNPRHLNSVLKGRSAISSEAVHNLMLVAIDYSLNIEIPQVPTATLPLVM